MRIEYLKSGVVVATVTTDYPDIEFAYQQKTLGVETWRVATNQEIPSATVAETPLEKARRLKHEEINARCAQDIIGGVYSSALGSMHKYDSDVVDQLNFTQAFLMALVNWVNWKEQFAAWQASHGEGEAAPVETPVPYRLWNTDGVTKGWYGHTFMQFAQVLSDGATAKATSLYKCSQLKALVDSLNGIDAIEAVSWEGI